MTLRSRANTFIGTLVAAVVGFFSAAPAFASETVETTSESSPVDVVAILVTGAVILAIVLVISIWVSGMLGKRG